MKAIHNIIRKSFFESKIRFISICLLIFLGTTVFVGLRVSGPDIAKTADHYYKKFHAVDLAVISDYGITKKDQQKLDILRKNGKVEYGYFQDAAIKGSTTGIRLFSLTSHISNYELVSGKFPEHNNEIAIGVTQKKNYKIGNTISFQIRKRSSLKTSVYKVVGYVKSPEIVSTTAMGTSTAGNGELSGFGVLRKKAFHTGVYTIARIRFDDLEKMPRNSTQYRKHLYRHKKQIERVLSGNGTKRLNAIKAVKYQIYTHRTLPGGDGVQAIDSTADGINAVAGIFPLVLYVVAALVTFTTMTRYVQEERTCCGLLKSLGYSRAVLMQKYLCYGFVAAIAGVAFGIIIGTFCLPSVLCSSLLSNTTIPKVIYGISWSSIILSVLFSIICTVLPTFYVVLKESKETAAQLLQPKPPTKGARVLLEYIPCVWRRLSFTGKVTVRNIVRYKQRMFMTIFGVAGSVMLLFAGLGIACSIQQTLEKQYGSIICYDVVVSLRNAQNEKEQRALRNYLSSNYDIKSLGIFLDSAEKEVSGQKDTQSIVMMALDSKHQKDYLRLESIQGASVKLSDTGVYISEKLASLLHVSKGDSISLKGRNGKMFHYRIDGICRMYVGHYIVMSKNYLQKVRKKSVSDNAYLLQLSNQRSEAISKVCSEVLGMDNVLAVTQNTGVKRQFLAMSDAMVTVMTVLTILSLLLAVVILSNLTNMNISERLRELCTIKVLGFFQREVTMYIYRETVILTGIGILIGLIAGRVLHRLILFRVSPAGILYPLNVKAYVYGLPIMTIIIVVLLLGMIVAHRLKKVNMLDALKSVE